MTVELAPEKVVGLDGCATHCDTPSPPSLDALRARLPDRQAHIETAELFRLLGDPTRVAILHALLAGGELCVCDLAEVVDVGENVVSQAMRLLRAADVVRTRRDGRQIHYRLADAHVRMLLDLSADHVSHATAATAATSNAGGHPAQRDVAVPARRSPRGARNGR